jgi:Xaa-Pro dipeptidase
MQRIARLRNLMRAEGLDGVVLTHPHDVLYTTGYRSVLERWGQQEPLAAVVVPCSDDGPVILCLPEANVGLLAVLEELGRPDRAQELRVFDMLVFCEVSRAADPYAKASSLGAEFVRHYGERVRGNCEPDVIASIAAALHDHGLAGKRLGYDDLRVGQHLARRHGDGNGASAVYDALDLMMRCRVVKTEPELETFRRVGQVADKCLAAASDALAPGRTWDEVQYDVADAMTRLDAIPVDEGAMLFGGAFSGEFIPELFRTRYDQPLKEGQIVILETQGTYEDFWIDINRTATIGPPSDEYQSLHDTLVEAFNTMVAELQPGRHTGQLPLIAQDHLRDAGIPTPEKLLVVCHGIGHMPLEYPIAFPSQGLGGNVGFEIEENMVLSLDCLYFGSYIGPCHMENVFIIGPDGAESTYATPLQLMGPR